MNNSQLHGSVKSTGVAYLFFFFFGAHYAYLGRWGIQLLYWVTGGGLLIWMLIDLFRMGTIVQEHNSKLLRQPDGVGKARNVVPQQEMENQERQRIAEYLNAPFDQAKEGAEPCFLIFDIETTGFAPDYTDEKDFNEWPWPVQIAWSVFNYEGDLIKSCDFILKQDVQIPADATKVHKITNEKMSELGTDPLPIYDEFTNDLKACKYLVAHNVDYDFKVMKAEFYRKGLKVSRLSKKKICTMKKSKSFCDIPFPSGTGVKYPKLIELAVCCFSSKLDPFRMSMAGMHNAAMDVQVTGKCFFSLLHTWEEISIEKE